MSAPDRRRSERRARDTALLAELRDEHALRGEILRGAVRALAQILAVADPIAYTQALRVQRLCLDLAGAMSLTPCWELESAALLAPLGGLSLAADLQLRSGHGDTLDPDEQRVLETLPALTDRLLAPVPGLEEVRAILMLRHGLPLPAGWPEHFGAARLAALRHLASLQRVAANFDAVLARGLTVAEAIGLLRGEAQLDEFEFVAVLERLHGEGEDRVELRSLPLSRLRVGMVIAEALYTTNGQLLVTRGFEITASFLERMANFRPGSVREPVQVILPR